MNEEENVERLEPVVKGKIRVKKPSFFERLYNAVFEQRDAGTVGGYLFKDIVVPTAKRFTYEVVTETLNQILYGGHNPNAVRTTGSHVNYRGAYVSNYQRPQQNVISGLDIFEFEKIMIPTRQEAQNVLDEMFDILSRYGLVRVSQFYDLTGHITDNTQANKFGWLDLSGAEVVAAFGGEYYIKLPKPYPLD